MRNLEIGPGKRAIPGFETLNLGSAERTEGGDSDHVGDARNLPFSNNTFDIVYSSHCIEHIPWYQLEQTIKEWIRVVKPGGKLEVWTVNGYKLAKALIEWEETGKWNGPNLGKWKPGGKEANWINNNPALFVGGRLFSYPRSGEYDSNLHRCLITPKFLKQQFEKNGLKGIRDMNSNEVRGYDHGWINMGVCGTK